MNYTLTNFVHARAALPWAVVATDWLNQSTTRVQTLHVGDVPQIRDIVAPLEIEDDEAFVLSARIHDATTPGDTGIALALTVLGGNETALVASDDDPYEMYYATSLSVGNYSWRLAALDNAGNWRNTSLAFVVVVPAHGAPTTDAAADVPIVPPPYKPPSIPALTWYTVVAVLTTVALLFAGRLPPLSKIKIPQLVAVVLVLALGAFVQGVSVLAGVVGAWPAWQVAIVYSSALGWSLLVYFTNIPGLAAGGIAVFATLAVLSFVAAGAAFSIAALAAWAFTAAAASAAAVLASPLLGVRLGVVLAVALAALAVFLLATYSIALALVWI